MNTLEKKPSSQANNPLEWTANNYVIRVFDHPHAVDATQWQTLLAAEAAQGRDALPFVTPTYLAALQDSGSATPATGWTLQLVTVWTADRTRLLGACGLYLKAHSYGEYVFDWAWADAHARHGLPYYPKGVVAVPFTPVPGPRLLATDDTSRHTLMAALLHLAERLNLSSLHLLFAHPTDLAVAQAAGLMLRHTVQFHWHNRHPTAQRPFTDFDDFLATLSQDKRKKIRQERRKVAQAGIRFRIRQGADISGSDWDFFYRCYERTYLEHGNAPYLSRDFFQRLADEAPQHWLLCQAHRPDGAPIASSLIAVNSIDTGAGQQRSLKTLPTVAHGRYWGALERVDCLHFEACYYQPIEWCIAHGVTRFEGGAQGEHKMARALLPVRTSSAHWLAHPAFADAIDRYLARETEGVDGYLTHLAGRLPFKSGT
ncbi:MAG: GNAT family N-acetyltransferase [Polaromonas sp.]|nr:GNAT family N-acetyltransferase [Polaromonas sp.]